MQCVSLCVGPSCPCALQFVSSEHSEGLKEHLTRNTLVITLPKIKELTVVRSRKTHIKVCSMLVSIVADLRLDSKYRKARRSRVERGAHLKMTW